MNNNSIIGNTYNYLTVLRRVGDHVTFGGNKFPAYECQCVCGRHKVVVAASVAMPASANEGLSSYYYTVYHDALKRMYAEANGYVYVAIDCDRKSDENIIE